MKAIKNAIPIALCAILVILPIFELIGLIFGLNFNLNNELVTAIVQTILAAGAVTALFIMKPEYDLLGRIFTLLLLPISLFNGLSFAGSESPYIIIFVVLYCGCCFALYLRFAPDSNLKAALAVVSVLLTVALVAIYIFNLIYGSFISKETVEDIYYSPEDNYLAEVTAHDGMLGGKTKVSVGKAKETNLLIGRFCYGKTTVYEGELYESETLKISWKNENTLVINGTEYIISDK